jgi:hypothetical protein
MTVAMSHEACFALARVPVALIDEIAHAEREGSPRATTSAGSTAFEQLLADKGSARCPRRSKERARDLASGRRDDVF